MVHAVNESECMLLDSMATCQLFLLYIPEIIIIFSETIV